MTEEGSHEKGEVFTFLAHEKPRPGQIEMIQESTEALRSGGYHLAAAPTGIGKTAAALAAALEISQNSPFSSLPLDKASIVSLLIRFGE
jgi:Rad3-related DNA helicase